VGGVLYRQLDRLAQVGDSIQFEGITMTVLALDGHRIARVAVERGGRPSGLTGPEEASA
jgi:CBS domain containing-hemolysin-like protein